MVGIADGIDRHQTAHRHPIALGDLREALSGAHHVRAGALSERGGFSGRYHLAGHLEGLAHLHVVGLADVVEGHQLVEGHALAHGDFGEGVAFPHGHPACGHSSASGGAAVGTHPARHLQLLAHLHVVGLADAVELHQLLHADAGAVGNFREGIARFHRDLPGHRRQRQHQGEGEGSEGAAHGHPGRQWRHVKGLARVSPAPPSDPLLNRSEWGLDAGAFGNG